MSKMKFSLLVVAVLTLSNCQSKKSKPDETIAKAAYSQFGIESVSKDDLKKYAPKDISASMKNKLSLYMDIQTPAGGQLHPNGKDLFFNWRISGYQQIWKMSGPNRYPVQMTGGKDLTTLVDIAPNGQFIIFHRDIDGQENPGIYIQPVNGGPLTKIFHEPKVRAAFQFITDDSKEIYFTSNHEDAQSFFVYKINVETKKVEPVSKEKGYWYVMDHEGDRLLLGFAKTSFTNDVYELNLKTKEKKWLLGEKSEDPFDVRFLRANNKYLVRTLDGDFESLKLLDNGKLKNIIKTEKHDIEHFELSNNRDFMAYELNKDGYTQLNIFKITSEGAISELNYKHSMPVNLKKADHLRIQFNRTNSKAIITSSSSQEPRNFYALDMISRQWTQWTKTNSPEVRTSHFAVANLEYYKAKDGTSIPMFVRRPDRCKKERNWPAFSCHFFRF